MQGVACVSNKHPVEKEPEIRLQRKLFKLYQDIKSRIAYKVVLAVIIHTCMPLTLSLREL